MVKKNTNIFDPYSVESLRNITFHLIQGRNFRILIEPNTQGRYFTTFHWLKELRDQAIKRYGENDWITEFFNAIQATRRKPKELKDIENWIFGSTIKGTVNLGYSSDDYPRILRETIERYNTLFEQLEITGVKNDAWLMLMAGSATLSIKGSAKSKYGKKLENVFLRACLTLLGLEENETFWVNIERDQEVERGSDAEVQTRRGRIRIESALIAPGNQEVIEDKIARVGRNGVIIFDKIGGRSRIQTTATNQGVELIQIRNSQPLTQLYNHLNPLVTIDLNEPPNDTNELQELINGLPDNIFE